MANSYSVDGGVTFQTPGLFQGLAAGTYNVVLASGPNGTECQVDTVVTIEEPEPLSIVSMTTDKTLCPGENITLSALGAGGNGNYTYTWDNGVGPGQSLNFAPSASTTVCMTLSEDCPSPTVTACIDITVPADVDFDYYFGDDVTAKTTAGCYPHSFNIKNISSSSSILDVNGNVLSPAADVTAMTTTWNFIGNKTLASAGLDSLNHTLTSPGVYDVEVIITTADKCKYTEFLPGIITVWDRPEADFEYSPDDISIFNTEANFVDMSIGDPVQWLWQFAGAPDPDVSTLQNPTVVYQQGKPGNYQVDLKIWDSNGCTDSVKKVLAIANDVNIYAPNIFTPDGDDYNDNWRVYISGVEIYDFHLSIFNRWGELVFESFDPEATWDGTYGNSGQVVMSGNYVWTIDTKDLQNDNRYEFSGSIIIMK
ncbi:MAG: gliding motility-associated C-terminal domain-containing protein [Putridiphycobacter sp.]|nr:gliding motility-associated C-terminal domain-containing protein [Putridiphycobacter sp.]